MLLALLYSEGVNQGKKGTQKALKEVHAQGLRKGYEIGKGQGAALMDKYYRDYIERSCYRTGKVQFKLRSGAKVNLTCKKTI